MTLSSNIRVDEYSGRICSAALLFHFLMLFVQTSNLEFLLPRVLLAGNIAQVTLVSIPIIILFLKSAPHLSPVVNEMSEERSAWKKAAWTCCAYGVMLTISSLHTIDGALTLSQIYLIPATIFSLTFCAPRLMKQSHYRALFFSIISLMLAHSLLTLCIMLTGIEQIGGVSVVSESGRSKHFLGYNLFPSNGFFSNANSIGSFLMYIPGMILAGGIFGLGKVQKLILNTIIIASTIASFCRAAILTVLCSTILPAVPARKKKASIAIAITAVSLALAFPVFSPILDAFDPNARLVSKHGSPVFQQQWRANEARATLEDRAQIWTHMVRSLDARHLLMGYGLYGINYNGKTPHNFLLANLVYYGSAGLTCIILLLLNLCLQVIRRTRHNQQLMPLAASLAAVLCIHGQFEYILTHPLFFSNSMFWLLIGFTCFAPLSTSTASEESNKAASDIDKQVKILAKS